MASDPDEVRILQAIIRLNGLILGTVLGLLTGLGIFLATNWLLIRGGDVVGPHLRLLNQFFPGYSVSFVGSLIGMVYGLVAGFVIGWFIAFVYNGVLWLKDR